MSTAQQIDERKLSPIPHASAAPAAERLTPGSFTMKVLNGISIAVVVSLVPQALLGELAKALLPFWSGAATVMALTGLAASLLPVMIGVLIGIEFKMTPSKPPRWVLPPSAAPAWPQ